MSGALLSAASGLALLCGVLLLWVGVQRLFQRAFPDPGGDPDALAGRLGCRVSCAPDFDCATRCPGRPAATKEEAP